MDGAAEAEVEQMTIVRELQNDEVVRIHSAVV
jgi:hypothetical protein